METMDYIISVARDIMSDAEFDEWIGSVALWFWEC